MLDRAQVRAFYDRFGARQDTQAFYEDAAGRDLIAHADFDQARRVYEFGCGTGRFAQELLERHLPAKASYVGVDLSTTMVELATGRLAAFGQRANVRRTDGAPSASAAAASFDRIVSLYVLDLLPEADIQTFVDDAARALAPGGRLCLASLTFGDGPLSRIVVAGWRLLFRLSPRIVGGCRPIHVADYLPGATWRIVHRRVVVAWGIPSEVVVAEPRPTR